MKVVCIKSGASSKHLTLNKIYDVISFTNNDYYLKLDTGCKYYISKNLFKPLQEIREEKLNNILK